MKPKYALLSSLVERFRRWYAPTSAVEDLPLRGELFSVKQMERHGTYLARHHILSREVAPDRLLSRLRENERLLLGVRDSLTEAIGQEQRIPPAAEWLLDNFYLIEEQIRTAKRHLPKAYSGALPRLDLNGHAALPRVYDLAKEAVSHGDGHLDLESFSRFISAYQAVSPLKIGELWAIPIMLRLALIENLRRVSASVAHSRQACLQATQWANRIIEVAERDPKNLVLLIADMARSDTPLNAPFVAEFTRRLQGQTPILSMPLSWMEQQLADDGLSIVQLVQTENHQLAVDQVSVSNSIGSLRFLAETDWREFVETMSMVDRTLRKDPAAIYNRMDFASRDRYRHKVEELASFTEQSESAIAEHALALSKKGAEENGELHFTAHVGFYLISQGRRALELAAGVRYSWNRYLLQRLKCLSFSVYAGAIVALTFGLTALVLAYAPRREAGGLVIVVLTLAMLISSSRLVLAFVNWCAVRLAAPSPLPKIDLSDGLPSTASTLVVIPAFLSQLSEIDELVEALEVRFLGNQDPNLYFSLLTDFVDAPQKSLPEDAQLLQHAIELIQALNSRYPAPVQARFYLFHRERLWNESERLWMGFERKRGKLTELNAFLRGKRPEGFLLQVGSLDGLENTKYVITLDVDTQLPRDAARELVGAMLHPLNQAQVDQAQRRVIYGYGVLQPRVAESLPRRHRSLFAQLWSAEPGVDPYTRAVSDVYQDIFGEGSFMGKGIYDVDVFERLSDRFPDNHILSHDLLEGCYARSGLVSDVALYEAYPASYRVDVYRRHRWIRGDWQLSPWLLPTVPIRGGRREPNPLPALSRWKLFDNLRRSLESIALFTLLVVGVFAGQQAGFWVGVVAAVLGLPVLFSGAYMLLGKPSGVQLRQHVNETLNATTRGLLRAAWLLMNLPFEAWYSLDAIARSTTRLFITRRRLLEWCTSTEVTRTGQDSVAAFFRLMWIAPVTALGLAGYVLFNLPRHAWAIIPLTGFWLISPWIAARISVPPPPREPALSQEQIRYLRRLSLKTWHFFETYLGEKDHWLPPDNFQEHPQPVVAHRTSPTNIGLALLATLAAYDFGYVSVGRLLRRLNHTLTTLERLPRYRGHFYNWYHTLTLEPLPPLYVSSVDSGNLVGHLLTLRAGLLELIDAPVFGNFIWRGLADTLHMLRDTLDEPALVERIQAFERGWCRALSDPAVHGNPLITLNQLIVLAHQLLEVPIKGEPPYWARALLAHCQDIREDLLQLMPWLAQESVFLELPGQKPGAVPSLRDLTRYADQQRKQRDLNPSDRDPSLLNEWAADTGLKAQARLDEIQRLVGLINEFTEIDYGFLYDSNRHLCVVGFNATDRRRDSGYYDLLASEARLGIFVGVAQGALPQESWFALGRQLNAAGGAPTLLSWSGSMFEYLMPLLVMPNYEHTLLDQTYRSAVARQIAYGRQRDIPWGVSESGYHTFDAQLNYQYRAFGVPSLGLKRGLADDLVVAPYASALALMVFPEAACQNLQRLSAAGFEGRYGMFEAIDYTSSRMPRGQQYATIRSYMAHHQGMSFLSFAYLLLDQPMQRRFESDPLFQATTLLLQERIPKATPFYTPHAQMAETHFFSQSAKAPVRMFHDPDTPQPEVQLLSNGRYHVMITHTGGGSSRWRDLAITRWREDTTCDSWGQFAYIRDLRSGEVWSTAYQPTGRRSEQYEAIFSEARVEFRRVAQEIESYTEVMVSPEDDIELRRVRITNRSRVRRTLEVTTYAEVVLASAAADVAHPAFNKLFVQTEIVASQQAILCNRRPRGPEEQTPWVFHQMAIHGAPGGETSYETDRMRFIGRGRTLAAPEALRTTDRLSGTDGSVLDPIVAIRYRFTLEPEQVASFDIVTGAVDTRLACLSLIEKYRDRHLADRVFELAWTHAQVVLRQLNATEVDAQLYGRLANAIFYAHASMRAASTILKQNQRGQPSLWSYAISGDLPIVLLQIREIAHIELVRELVQAHAYWRQKGLLVDLVIWNEDHAGYRQLLQEQILGLIAAGIESNVIDRPGGIFVRLAEHIPPEDRILLQSAARIVLSDQRGTLIEQLSRRGSAEVRAFPFKPRRAPFPSETARKRPKLKPMVLSNGFGGFTEDGSEYQIETDQTKKTPAPWVNVIANPTFGTVVTESGSAYTWYENAHEFRLTPWYNDPVTDSSGEAIYLRDEDTGHFWSPTGLPCIGSGPFIARHGFGYSEFEHIEEEIETRLTVFVALDEPVKFSVLQVKNSSREKRRLAATGYVEWVLGELRTPMGMHVITEIDPNSGALLARNAYNTVFNDHIAFLDVDETMRSLSGDRTEFIGRNGSLQCPAVMGRTRLSGKVGAALDPCGAVQVPFELEEGESREIIFRLGLGRGKQHVTHLIRRFRGSSEALSALESVKQYWQHTLGAVQVATPDPALNVLVNGWLIYQTLGCRLWGRSGYYQSGGAYGFRDQLQDAMALVHTEPKRLKTQLLLCATRQFIEGDVQHWWHPPSGRGVRTRCSDDYLWLPFGLSRYLTVTRDTSILKLPAPYLEGRPVGPEEESYYDMPVLSDEHGTLYQHCVRAICHGMRFGEHGLPLMGSGDWNDGMDRVGILGKGESVWLAFFLYDILLKFAPIARSQADESFAAHCETTAATLRLQIEQQAWDGHWYRRAYCDDGTPLGSASNTECRIDSIAQSWSVLSGAAEYNRAQQAMESLYTHLVRVQDRLVQLLDPPFNSASVDPGYIRGYVPGVRENGGQYTHAAIWAAMAFAERGEIARAWELQRLINPVNHSLNEQEAQVYKVEPYVVSADVYAVAPHVGRGGWSWYTGSAGWMYRLIVESLLGLRREGSALLLSPKLPAHWEAFSIDYRLANTSYRLDFRRACVGEEPTLTLDAQGQLSQRLELIEDGQQHRIELILPMRLNEVFL